MVANRAGTHDVFACVNGYFVSIEVKKPGEQPKPLQLYNADKIRKSGGIAIVATSVDEVRTAIQHLTRRT